MKVGITLPDNVLKTATQAKPQTPYPGSSDGSLSVEYQTAFDPLDVLAYVGANTSKISLGTSVIDIFFYTPTREGNIWPWPWVV